MLACLQQLCAAHQHLTGLWNLQPTQQSEQAGFARAVVANNADALLLQLQVQPIKHRGLAALQADIEQLHAAAHAQTPAGR